MMALATARPHLIDRLSKPRGRLVADAPLGPQTWFRTGGPAEVLFRPADVEDLSSFLASLPNDVAVTVLGVGSNLLVRDGGVKGVVIRLMRSFTAVSVEGHEVVSGAGALDLNVALTAREHSLAGLEFLSGIPGTIGGAVAMNGGAYGGELSQVLVSAEAVDRAGAVQPRSRTGGSTFVNPPGHKAWELIDGAGCRGLRLGDAQVSEKHCNFLINLGSATAADIEALGEEVRRRVLAHSGVQLEWEIRRIGEGA